jgi:hypothetical protein
MQVSWILVSLSLLTALTTVCRADIIGALQPLDDPIKRQTIQNNTAGMVNDLQVFFSKKVTQVKVNTRDTPPKTATGVLNGDSLGAQFAPNTFGDLGQSGKLDVDFSTDDKTAFGITAASMWTLDGKAQGAVTILGEPMPLAFVQTPAGLQGFVTFINPDPFPEIYSDIQIFSDNNIANFDINDFLTPTGTLVGGIPSSVMLPVGGTATFSMGIVDPTKYELAIAEVASTSDPTNLFNVATADTPVVPEPGAGALLGTAVAALFIRSRFSMARRLR